MKSTILASQLKPNDRVHLNFIFGKQVVSNVVSAKPFGSAIKLTLGTGFSAYLAANRRVQISAN